MERGQEIARPQDILRAPVVLEFLNIPQAYQMQENLAVFDFELTADDNAKIATLDLGKSLIFDHSNPEIAKFLMNYKVDV